MGIQARRYGAATPSCGEPAPDLREANRIRHGRPNRYRRVSGPPCDIGRTAPRGVAQNRRASQICQLERVAGRGIIPPRRTNSAHLHRPGRPSWGVEPASF